MALPRGKAKLHEGLRHVSATGLTLSLIMNDGDAVQLAGEEVARLLTEVAKSAPALLHDALERRLVSLIATEVRYQLAEGELQCPHSLGVRSPAQCVVSRWAGSTTTGCASTSRPIS